MSNAVKEIYKKNKNIDFWEILLSGGEDYELLFTMANKSFVGEFESEWKHQFDTPLTCIGKVVKRSAKDKPIVLTNASPRIDLTGYAHFGNP